MNKKIIIITSFLLIFILFLYLNFPCYNEEYFGSETIPNLRTKLPQNIPDKDRLLKMKLNDPETIIDCPGKYVHAKYVIFAAELDNNCNSYYPISDYVEVSAFNFEGIMKITIILKKTKSRRGIVSLNDCISTSSTNIIANRTLTDRDNKQRIDNIIIWSRDGLSDYYFVNRKNEIEFTDNLYQIQESENCQDENSESELNISYSKKSSHEDAQIIPTQKPESTKSLHEELLSEEGLNKIESKNYYPHNIRPLAKIKPMYIIKSDKKLISGSESDLELDAKSIPSTEINLIKNEYPRKIIDKNGIKKWDNVLLPVIHCPIADPKKIGNTLYPDQDKCEIKARGTRTDSEISLEYTYAVDKPMFLDSKGKAVEFSNLLSSKESGETYLDGNNADCGVYYHAEYRLFPAVRLANGNYKKISMNDIIINMKKKIDFNACKSQFSKSNLFNSITVNVKRRIAKPYGNSSGYLPLNIPNDEAFIIANNLEPPPKSQHQKPKSGTGKIDNIGWFFTRKLYYSSQEKNRCEHNNLAVIMLIDADGNVCSKFQKNFRIGNDTGIMSFIDYLPPLIKI
jgi:hypothetical protein